MSVDSTAANILRRGVELDQKNRYTEALVCYQEGLQILVDKIKNEADNSKRTYLRGKIEEYMQRAEIIKQLVVDQKEAGKFHEQVHIENGSTGHSYKTLFGRFLDSEVTSVNVEDPYIRSFYQCQNFLRLCELLVKSCPCLVAVNLMTGREERGEQAKWFESLTDDLKRYKIRLNVQYSNTLHDRKITLSTGWIIKIGRGLDIYKPPDSKFSLGVYDLDLRQCYETDIDILHENNIRKTYG